MSANVIRNGAAITSGPAKGGASDPSPSGAADPLTQAEEADARIQDQKELDQTAGAGERPEGIDIGGRRVAPGSNGAFDVAGGENELPLPLLLALISLTLLSLAGGFLVLRPRVPLLARISLPWSGRPRRPRG